MPAFRAAVREDFAQADRGEFIEEEEMDARLEQMLRRRCVSVDAAAAAILSTSAITSRRHPRYRQPTMRKLYEGYPFPEASPHRGRTGREMEPESSCFSATLYRCLPSEGPDSNCCESTTPPGRALTFTQIRPEICPIPRARR